MIVTIQNLTDEPIIAQTYSTSSKLGIKPSSKRTLPLRSLVLQPSCRLTTRLPKGELILHAHSRTGVPKLTFFDDEKASNLEEEGWLFDPVGHKISLSTISTSWNVVPLPHGSIWRIFSLRVRIQFLIEKTV